MRGRERKRLRKRGSNEIKAMEREKAETKERNCDYKLSIEKDRKESEEQRQKTNEMGKKENRSR